jgi:excisionase family DNA binding protein
MGRAGNTTRWRFNTTEVARMLELDRSRITALARAGKLRGERIGRDWTFTKQAIDQFKKLERPAHRPVR